MMSHSEKSATGGYEGGEGQKAQEGSTLRWSVIVLEGSLYEDIRVVQVRLGDKPKGILYLDNEEELKWIRDHLTGDMG